jgi:hypothetical protein
MIWLRVVLPRPERDEVLHTIGTFIPWLRIEQWPGKNAVYAGTSAPPKGR